MARATKMKRAAAMRKGKQGAALKEKTLGLQRREQGLEMEVSNGNGIKVAPQSGKEKEKKTRVVQQNGLGPEKETQVVQENGQGSTRKDDQPAKQKENRSSQQKNQPPQQKDNQPARHRGKGRPRKNQPPKPAQPADKDENEPQQQDGNSTKTNQTSEQTTKRKAPLSQNSNPPKRRRRSPAPSPPPKSVQTEGMRAPRSRRIPSQHNEELRRTRKMRGRARVDQAKFPLTEGQTKGITKSKEDGEEEQPTKNLHARSRISGPTPKEAVRILAHEKREKVLQEILIRERQQKEGKGVEEQNPGQTGRVLRNHSQLSNISQAGTRRQPPKETQPPAQSKEKHTAAQQKLLFQTQAVTQATYNALTRKLDSKSAFTAQGQQTDEDRETTDIINELNAHPTDLVSQLPIGKVFNVARYLDTQMLSRLAQTCKALYQKLKVELRLRKDSAEIPDWAWRDEVRLGLFDEEGRRTVEWNIDTGFHPKPMELATLHGRVDDVRAYLRMGADPNCLNVYGIRPLRWAVAAGKPEVVQLLLEDEADANLLDEDGSGGALAGPFIGRRAEMEQLVESLLAAGAQTCSIEAFENLCHCRKAVAYIQRAIANGSKLAQLRGLRGETVLQVAATLGLKEVVAVLVAEGLDLDAVNDHGQTALHCALRDGSEETALVLMDAGCALDPLDHSNRDALALAVEKGYTSVVTQLLDTPNSNIDFNATRKYGENPSADRRHLEGAFHFRRLDIMKQMLLKRSHQPDDVLHAKCRALARSDPIHAEVYEDIALLMGSSMLSFGVGARVVVDAGVAGAEER
ncbi:ankyrin [Aspergillus homomorphus CBS 101889]|uniref:Ankyrin n=1 Tax=Aspergillus homomorphus (strain CBS 101889) TaxID=1450537 RepID=A0A395HKZ7_ASPHC|nr:ankyrin [Aspergillus homomorphus CBS 101889]RAL07905.1 ankyrin [Aspergillus homomorphus CBS 101889]